MVYSNILRKNNILYTILKLKILASTFHPGNQFPIKGPPPRITAKENKSFQQKTYSTKLINLLTARNRLKSREFCFHPNVVRIGNPLYGLTPSRLFTVIADVATLSLPLGTSTIHIQDSSCLHYFFLSNFV